MMNTEELLIEEIKQLFQKLVDEEKGHFVPGTNYRYTLPPDKSIYGINARKLIAKAHELSALNHKYDAYSLDEILCDEIPAVENHVYKYKNDSNIPTNKSVNELIALMHDATCHIRTYFFDVLGDMNVG